ncbi:MAG: pilin [Firmicutes bacterium]|nr:pilin [Bacillota bacterium]
MGGAEDEVRNLVATLASVSAALSIAVVSAAKIFALFLGWRLALADDEQKRKNVKGQMVWTVLGIMVVLAIIAIWGALSGFLLPEGEDGTGGVASSHNPVIHIAAHLSGNDGVAWLYRVFLGLMLGMTSLLAIYLGVQISKAEDESKRRNAKAQMVYAVIAILLLIGLFAIFETALPMILPDPYVPGAP